MSDQLSISWEWEPAEGVTSPELSATFARLRIELGDNNLTLVEDKTSRSSRRSIYVALYPLAEWVAYNWWNLNFDARPSKAFTRIADSKHSVRASGDGFKWPNLTIIPEGDRSRLVWRGESSFDSHSPIRFLGSGDAFVDREELSRELAGLVHATIGRLREMDVANTALDEEWSSLQSLDQEEREFCVAAARLGLDPFSEAFDFQGEILAAATHMKSEAALLDLFEAANPNRLDASLAWVLESSEKLAQSVGSPSEWPSAAMRAGVQGATVPKYSHPARAGWRQAQAARSAVGLGAEQHFDLAPYLSEEESKSDDRNLLAVGRSGAVTSSGVVLGQRAPRFARRFTLARAVWRQVATDDDLFVITNAHTDRQKIERAFAAELLAPAEGIASLLETEPSDADQQDIDELAEHFDVSSILIEHQLENQLIGRR